MLTIKVNDLWIILILASCQSDVPPLSYPAFSAQTTGCRYEGSLRGNNYGEEVNSLSTLVTVNKINKL